MVEFHLTWPLQVRLEYSNTPGNTDVNLLSGNTLSCLLPESALEKVVFA